MRPLTLIDLILQQPVACLQLAGIVVFLTLMGALLFADLMKRAGRGDFEEHSHSLRSAPEDPMPMTTAPSLGDA